VKERPILYNAQMVRAVLADQKKQTRRAVNPQPFADPNGHGWQWHGGPALERAGYGAPYIHCDLGEHFERAMLAACPHGTVGDRLWVRETHAIVPRTAYRCSEGVQQVLRPDDDHDAAIFRASFDRSGNPGWRPSIHMPRWASRLTLEITGVRVERLQAISEADARAEGCSGGHAAIPGYAYNATPGERFIALWKSIYGPASWDADPWMWVIDFKRLDAEPRNHG